MLVHVDTTARNHTTHMLLKTVAEIYKVSTLELIRRPLEEGPPGCEASARSSIFDLRLRWNHIIALIFFVFSHFGSSKGSIFHFSCLMSHVSCLRSCWMVYCTQKKDQSPSTHSGLRIWDDPRITSKLINFQANLQGNKSHENWSQGYPKSWKIDPEIIRNPISAKVVFCNTFIAKCLFLQS